MHALQKLVDFRQRQEQAIPQISLSGTGQLATRALLLDFLPCLRSPLILRLWVADSLLWQHAVKVTGIACPIPHEAQRRQFLFDRGGADSSTSPSLFIGTHIDIVLQLAELHLMERKLTAHDPLEMTNMDVHARDSTFFQRTFGKAGDECIAKVIESPNGGATFRLAIDLPIGKQEQHEIGVVRDDESPTLNQTDILFQTDESGVCGLLVRGLERLFEPMAAVPKPNM